jgi:ADP-heptose:LPS heptosyltransferase
MQTMDTYESLMRPDAPAMVLARQLLRIRRSIAPPDSRRERVLRWGYMPLIRALQRRQMQANAGGPPRSEVVTLSSLRTRRAGWPARPRILILKLDHLGDLIVAMPALARLRGAFPDAEITLLCASWNRAWAERSALVDRVIAFDFFATTKAEWRGATQAHFDRFAALGLGAFDLAIDLRHDPDTRPLLAQVDAGIRIGFAAPPALGGGCMDIALPDMEHISLAAGTGRPVHAELRLDTLAAAVIAALAPPPHPVRSLLPSAVEPPTPRPFAVLAPGAGSPIRVWPIERLAAVGRMLVSRYGLDLVLVGSAAQGADCARMAEVLPPAHVRDLAGQVPIADLPALFSRASLVVGYDTGTSHLAATLGVPTVTIMGAIADAEVWRVDGERAVAITSKIACAACYLSQAAECPFDVRCMTAITEDHVLAACAKVLAPVAAHSC